MLTVIFGAGASYDSDPSKQPHHFDDPNRPPLANDLFADRPDFRTDLARFPECLPVVPLLRHLAGKTQIEEVLERLQSESTSPTHPDHERVKQLAAVRFYLQTVIDGCWRRWYKGASEVTNYLTLLDEIRHFGNQKVVIVTFNYDRLIELAIERLTGRTTTKFEDYLALGPFALFKVHGSVNWGRVVTRHETAAVNSIEHIVAVLIRDATTIEVGEEYVLVDNYAPIVRDNNLQQVLLPAVAVPVQNKQAFECPRFLLDDLETRLSRTTHMLIVGWRGMDRHFAELLRSHLPSDAQVQIVCGRPQDATEVKDRLEALGVKARYEILGHTFTSYVLERSGRGFLSDSARNS